MRAGEEQARWESNMSVATLSVEDTLGQSTLSGRELDEFWIYHTLYQDCFGRDWLH